MFKELKINEIKNTNGGKLIPGIVLYNLVNNFNRLLDKLEYNYILEKKNETK